MKAMAFWLRFHENEPNCPWSVIINVSRHSGGEQNDSMPGRLSLSPSKLVDGSSKSSHRKVIDLWWTHFTMLAETSWAPRECRTIWTIAYLNKPGFCCLVFNTLHLGSLFLARSSSALIYWLSNHFSSCGHHNGVTNCKNQVVARTLNICLTVEQQCQTYRIYQTCPLSQYLPLGLMTFNTFLQIYRAIW